MSTVLGYQVPSWLDFGNNGASNNTNTAQGLDFSNTSMGGTGSLTNQNSVDTAFGVNTGSTGGIGGAGASGLGTGLNWNVGTGQLAASGLQSLGSLWSAWQNGNMAQKQFKYASALGQANLTNSVDAYNTNLSDKINARAKTEGLSQDQVNSYLSANKLNQTKL